LNRSEWQQLSAERIDDARTLLVGAKWSGAYYLAGYSLECALKSCVLAYIERTGIIFEDKKYAERCWTHNIEDLLGLAGLAVERERMAGANFTFGQNWTVAKDWSEQNRYRMSTQLKAEELFDALTDHTNGVLPWVRNYW